MRVKMCGKEKKGEGGDMRIRIRMKSGRRIWMRRLRKCIRRTPRMRRRRKRRRRGGRKRKRTRQRRSSEDEGAGKSQTSQGAFAQAPLAAAAPRSALAAPFPAVHRAADSCEVRTRLLCLHYIYSMCTRLFVYGRERRGNYLVWCVRNICRASWLVVSLFVHALWHVSERTIHSECVRVRVCACASVYVCVCVIMCT